MAVFLVIGLLLAPLLYKPTLGSANTEQGVFGGPTDKIPGRSSVIFETASAFSDGRAYSSIESPPQETGVRSDVLPGALDDGDSDFGQSSSRESLLVYRIQKGDTISGIASYFGVSLDTIVNANPSIRGRFLVPGDELKILPTSGSVYLTREGDTLESIADQFNVPEDRISKFNKSINFSSLGAAVSIVIPGVRGYIAQRNSSLPNFSNYFVIPAQGFNWGKLHHYNAVDIANSCGTPIVASAEGLVVPDESFGDGGGCSTDYAGCNGGYGSFVLIEHPFGDSVRTRYAHLSKILVGIGDYVKQGQEIGRMGDTGHVDGTTGCHVHFEVYGAQNPFAK